MFIFIDGFIHLLRGEVDYMYNANATGFGYLLSKKGLLVRSLKIGGAVFLIIIWVVTVKGGGSRG